MRRAVLAGVLGFLVGAVTILGVVNARVDWLARMEFALNAPPVPPDVLTRIRDAERLSYAQRAGWRRTAEELQDALVLLSPELAYSMNFSVGRYRIKASTIEMILPWAIERGYVSLDPSERERFTHALAYFAEQPSLNDWQAAVYLEWLRQDHPGLKAMDWADIAASDALVAKLYSGYMGAGGDWDGWRSDLVAGPIARERLQLQ